MTSTTTPIVCLFQGCDALVDGESQKCAFHRNRKKCSVDFCSNQVYARGFCIRHGGKLLCCYPQCSRNARKDGVCTQHSQLKPLCSVAGCSKLARRNQKCVGHGGGHPCIVPGCHTNARFRGHCWRHRHCLPKSAAKVAHAPMDMDRFTGFVDDLLQDIDIEAIEPGSYTPWTC
ncbi:hypothetical protein SPRG_13535 [Saprolegnia parasitica CBS 223.65]|uniref:Uncharacterized protein n=1 Tax=Saprolegnia parasitica (strain CBS 223.65) TaxID=695850 RepID=A0A067BRA9_SAPPC|nr:hypothetical protein SPRG_13535 [Saprolegnia parasitica CBS 223.65]KDO20783.1 hypothetical protein SPRG_13535 [Saprolegnia parasitica CBS 223.65]|eukprot:XP_012208521.1 hypothetical protein SPRG_13535 [Saprolegnia parasitica CBS 223.65]